MASATLYASDFEIGGNATECMLRHVGLSGLASSITAHLGRMKGLPPWQEIRYLERMVAVTCIHGLSLCSIVEHMRSEARSSRSRRSVGANNQAPICIPTKKGESSCEGGVCNIRKLVETRRRISIALRPMPTSLPDYTWCLSIHVIASFKSRWISCSRLT
jgi:hypothetical protein